MAPTVEIDVTGTIDSSQRNIITDKNDISVLEDLIKFASEPTRILELDCYEHFPEDEIIPIEECNPKSIIRHTLKKHQEIEFRLRSGLSSAERLVYLYVVDEQEYKVIFDNNMSLHFDIQVICYIYYILLYEKFNLGCFKLNNCRPLMELMDIIRCKYEIKHICIDHVPSNSKMITLCTITHSYPSIALNMFHKGVGCSPILSVILSFLDLPRAMFSHMIGLVLPPLEQYPFAILLAITIQFNDIAYPAVIKLPLTKLCQHILKFYKCTAFPSSLKLELCRRLGIVDVIQDQYKFSPCIVNYRQKAKDLIKTLRRKDPQLETLLCKM